MSSELHAYGYEGDVENAVPVHEYHRAECTECEWISELFDEYDWRSAEQEAIDHYTDEHLEEDEEDEEDDG